MKMIPENSYTIPGTATGLILVLSCLTVASLLWYGPIPQDPSYHGFADQQTLFSVPHFWNVVSNIPFLLVGWIGLHKSKALKNHPHRAESRACYFLFFTGIFLTGLGSAYYHLQPTDWGLFWDRLAMALSFMAFLTIIVGEFISHRLGRQLLVPFVLFGLSSVVCWIITEHASLGDLRLYAITQFLPMAIILVIIFSWKSEAFKIEDILIIGAGYGLAKVCEVFDSQFYQTLALSGHTLKHIVAAFSAYWVAIVLSRYPKKVSEK